jgi:hypothetical protein
MFNDVGDGSRLSLIADDCDECRGQTRDRVRDRAIHRQVINSATGQTGRWLATLPTIHILGGMAFVTTAGDPPSASGACAQGSPQSDPS